MATSASHNPPELQNLLASVAYTEGDPPLTLSPSAFIFSPDGYRLITTATVQIDPASFQPGDELLVYDTTLATSSTSGIYSGINVFYDFNAATGILTLSGLDTAIDYSHVLANVQFASTSDNPDNFGFTTTRTIDWQVTDGAVPSGPDFAAPVQYPTTGVNPQAVAISRLSSDFNGDLIPDIAVANATTDDVSILLGNGDGTFQSAVNFPAGASPSSVAVGDFNGDFIDDLAVTDKTGNAVSILLGDGVGGFAAPISTSTGTAPTSLTTGDFNGDNKLDVAVATAGSDPTTIPGSIWVMGGDGTGHFGLPTVLPTGLNPSFVLVAGLHVVGSTQEQDLVVVDTGSNDIRVWLGDGAGNFVPSATAILAVGTAPVSVAAADLNGDGWNDLAVANSGSDNVTVWFNNGNGTFSASTTVSVGTAPHSIAIGDFRGIGISGRDAFVTANGGGDVSVVYANGDGTFQPAVSYAAGPAGTNATSIAVGDLTGDGNQDLVVTDAAHDAVSVLLHNPTTQSAVYTTGIEIAAVNDPPVNSVPGPQTIGENTFRAIPGLSVDDPDAQTMTVTLTVQHGTIHVLDNLGPGFLDATDITGNDTNSVILNCDLAAVDATLAATNGVVYHPNTNYLGGDTLTMVSNDGGETGSGGGMTDSDVVLLTVNPAVTFTGLDDHPTFTEDGPFVTLDANHNAAIQNAATFDGAVLTLQRDGSASPDDLFHSPMFTEGQVFGSTADPIGSYALSAGVLTITFNANATESDVDSVLQSLTYANSSNNPPSTVQVDYSFNDTQNTATGAIVVTVNAVNDPPVLNGVSSTDVYTAGGSAVVLSPNAVVSDPDSTTLASATVHITDGFGADTLSANAGSTGIGVSYDPGTFTLTLSGAHTLDQYSQVLDTVTYSSSDTDPTGGGSHPTRSISWVVNDGAANGQSDTQTTTLFYAPILDLDQSGGGTGFSGAFTENGASVAIADTDDFIFTSNGEIDSATIVLTNAHPGDTLTYDHTVGAITSITDTSNPNQIVLGLQGPNSASAYQLALQHVFYSNTSDNPDASARQITVVVSDPAASSNTAIDTITVTPVNDAPVAQDASVNGHENHPISGAAVATDVDNTPDQLSYALVGTNGGAQHGTVSMDGHGNFTYTPASNFVGNDSFVFQANDGQADSNQATITVDVAVNHAPVAQNGSASGNEDTAITGSAGATDSDGDTLTYALVGANGGATHGTVSFNTNGMFTYTPAHDFNGSDTFNFKANDGTDDSNTASMAITVNPVNDPPVAANGSASGNEDNVITGSVPAASDVDNTPAQLHYFLVGTNGGAAHGTVSLNPNGSFTYTPAKDFNGSDSFSFKANDGTDDSNTATMTITVNPVNDAPVAQNGSASGDEDTAITGNAVATDVDNTPAQLKYLLVGTNGGAAHGTVSLGANGSFTYTPIANFNGTDSFNFKANDGALDSNTASVAITVNPVDDPPVITSNGGGDTATISILENTTAVTTVTATDLDGPALTFALSGGADQGKFTINPTTGVLAFATAPDFERPTDSDHNNTYIVQVRASDGTLTDDQTITVNVLDRPDSFDGGFYGDINGDGKSDVFLRDNHGPIGLWLLDGGTALFAEQIGGVGPEWHVEGYGDFNGDGRDDVLWQNTAGTVMTWQLNRGQITPQQFASPGLQWHVAGLGDFNGDGRDDIFWRDTAGHLLQWQMDGGIKSATVFGGVGLEWHVQGVADFGGDGKDDILWRSDTGALLMFQMNGTARQEDFFGQVGLEWHIRGTGDFDGDHKQDILWQNDNGLMMLWRMDGAHILSQQTFNGLPMDWHVYGTGDFNADGKADIMWRNENGAVAIWEMDGANVVHPLNITQLDNVWNLGVHLYDLV